VRLLTNIVRKTNREGKYWAAMKLDDGRGTADAMVFATRYEELLAAIQEDAAVFIRASILRRKAPPNFPFKR